MEFIQSGDALLDWYKLFVDISLEVRWNFLVLGILTITFLIIGFVTTTRK